MNMEEKDCYNYVVPKLMHFLGSMQMDHNWDSSNLNPHDDRVDGLGEQLDPGHAFLVADRPASLLAGTGLQHHPLVIMFNERRFETWTSSCFIHSSATENDEKLSHLNDEILS